MPKKKDGLSTVFSFGSGRRIRPALRGRPPRVARRPRRLAKCPRVRILLMDKKTARPLAELLFHLAAGEGFDLPCGAGHLAALERSRSNPILVFQMKKPPSGRLFHLAAGEGFEPSHTESESAVLPLHNPAISHAQVVLYPIPDKSQDYFSFSFPICSRVLQCFQEREGSP